MNAQTPQTLAQTSHTLWVALGIVVAVLALVAFWVIRKSAPLPGDNVFRASRWTRGNRLFPAQVIVTSTSLTLYRPQWIGKFEESIHMAHIASIKIDTHVLFADVSIETSGGQDPIVSYGHTKGDAVAMKAAVEKFQSDYYRTQK